MVSRDIRLDQNLARRIIHPPENIANLKIPPRGSQVSLTVKSDSYEKGLTFSRRDQNRARTKADLHLYLLHAP